jgi:hypothetical protein
MSHRIGQDYRDMELLKIKEGVGGGVPLLHGAATLVGAVAAHPCHGTFRPSFVAYKRLVCE